MYADIQHKRNILSQRWFNVDEIGSIDHFLISIQVSAACDRGLQQHMSFVRPTGELQVFTMGICFQLL